MINKLLILFTRIYFITKYFLLKVRKCSNSFFHKFIFSFNETLQVRSRFAYKFEILGENLEKSYGEI